MCILWTKKNVIFKKKVNVGLRKEGFVEVINGLKSLDLVVYEGINKIKEGTLVKIKWIYQSFLLKNPFFV